MDGENHGKPYEQMDDLGGFPIIFGSTPKLVSINQLSMSKVGAFHPWNFQLQQRRLVGVCIVLFGRCGDPTWRLFRPRSVVPFRG